MEIVNICTINFLNNTIQCLPEKSCCPTSNHKQIWDSWYIWLGVAFIFVFLLTSLIIYFVSLCKKKQQNLIRIRNLNSASECSAVISTISGPGGIIQPDIKRFNNQVAAQTDICAGKTSTRKEKVSSFAEPLSPAYPPIEPVSIIKGSAPPEGFRQTDLYTEIALPPGYIDSAHYKP